jgi:hypothetical protein
MSKYFRPWNIDQTLLLPPNVQDFVPKGHVSRFIVELVRESLDLKEITGSYVSGLGQPPFDPRMMVALILGAHGNGPTFAQRNGPAECAAASRGSGSSTESIGGPRASRSDRHESDAAMRGGYLWAPVDEPGKDEFGGCEVGFSERRIVRRRAGLIGWRRLPIVADLVKQLRAAVIGGDDGGDAVVALVHGGRRRWPARA